jgi:phospholipase C
MAGLDQVQHIVVLMLENRSFDHLCGFLKRRIPALDGLTGAETIPRDPATGPGDPVQVSDDALPVIDVDPGHAIGDVSQQMYGRPEPAFPDGGANNGFVANYRKYAPSDQAADDIMRCFAPESLPVLTTLAEEFAICDGWFASLPGPTWPNRVFVHAGTSAGHTDNGFRLYDVPTIFQRLEQARRTWCVYYHDVPQALVFPHVAPHYLNPFSRKVRPFEQRFADDVRRGRLADYVFIEPRYLDAPELDANRQPTGRWLWANDQHPPHDVRHGESLIADVYEALRQSRLWSGVLMIVLYDEHGGFYDHAFPDRATPPAASPPGSGLFRFDRLGVRVPAVVVSPLVERGALDHDASGRPIVRDHTSVLATIEKRFGLAPLGDRDAAAPALDTLLTRSTLRLGEADAPMRLPRPARESPGPPVSGPGSMASATVGRSAAMPATAIRAGSRRAVVRRDASTRASGPRRERPLNDLQQNILQLLAHASALQAARARGKPSAGTRTVGESVGYLVGATPALARPGAVPRVEPAAKKAPAKRTPATGRARRPATPARRRNRAKTGRSTPAASRRPR